MKWWRAAVASTCSLNTSMRRSYSELPYLAATGASARSGMFISTTGARSEASATAICSRLTANASSGTCQVTSLIPMPSVINDG